jgi:hypothetical protein
VRQVNVSLPDDLRGRLDAASSEGDRTLGEEVRRGLEDAFFWNQFDEPTRLLMAQVGFAAKLTKGQTGRAWRDHPAAHQVFKQAITSLLARRKPAGNAELDPAELPADRPVASTDLTEMGIALEALISLGRPLTDEEQRDLHTRLHGDDAYWRAALQSLVDGTRPPPARLRSPMRKPKDEGGHE